MSNLPLGRKETSFAYCPQRPYIYQAFSGHLKKNTNPRRNKKVINISRSPFIFALSSLPFFCQSYN
jgi:hypothetical protein